MTATTVATTDTIVAKYNQEVARTRALYSDTRKFTPDFLRELLAELYVDAKQDIADAVDQATADAVTRRAQLERTLFGIQPGEDVVAFRDATDRVAAMKEAATQSGNATRYYVEQSNNAVAAGDVGIARAIAKLGYEYGIPQLVSAYVDNAPTSWGLVRAVTEMNTLPSASPAAALHDDVHTRAKSQISKPAELGGLDDYAIAALAQTASH